VARLGRAEQDRLADLIHRDLVRLDLGALGLPAEQFQVEISLPLFAGRQLPLE
jgi:hypothetical protein